VRILRITSSFPEKKDVGKYAGLEPNAYHLSRIESEAGHVVLVVAAGDPPGLAEVDGFRVLRISPVRMARWLMGPRSLVQARRCGFRADIVHGLNPTSVGWLLRASRRIMNAKYVFSLHGSHSISTAEFRKLVLFLSRRANGTVVVSHFLAKNLLKDGASMRSIRVIPSGVDTDLFTPSRLPSEPNMLFAGTIRPIKRVGFLVRAFSEVKRRIPDATLTIVGGHLEGHEDVIRIIRALGLKDSVHIVPGVSHFDMPEFYRQAYVVVLSSKMEGLGKVLLEAGSVGRPSVAPEVGGIPDVVINGVTGFLYERDSLRSFVSRLEAVLTNPTRAQRMGKAASKSVRKKFSWQAVAQAYEELFNELLEN